MKKIISLWWSLFWRLLLLQFGIALVLMLIVPLAIPTINTWPSIATKPTLLWFGSAVFLLLTSACSTPFFERLLWGERLHLSGAQWLLIARATAAFWFILGALNLGIYREISMETWKLLKTVVPLPAFAVWLVVVAARALTLRSSGTAQKRAAP